MLIKQTANYLDILPLELQDYIWELHHRIEFKKVMNAIIRNFLMLIKIYASYF